MAAAPQVQTLAQVMADLDPAYSGQQTLLESQRSGLGAKYDAQRAGITAAKGQGFSDINNSATGRGMSFSGIPLDEQATYLSTKYLPGMQAADASQNQEDVGLQQEEAKLKTDQTTQAMGVISNQQSALNAWNLQQAQLEASARENALNRAADASNAAANRAASAPKAVSPDNAALGYLTTVTGRDGFVSPQSFRTARDLFIQAGGSNADFMNKYWRFTGTNKGQPNQNNWKSYYYG